MCDCESPEFYQEKQCVARLTHQCEECRLTIVPGERYVRITGKWDGMVQSFAEHIHCLDWLRGIAAYHDRGGGSRHRRCISFGGLVEELEEINRKGEVILK